MAEENEAMDGESLASLLARRASTGCAQQQELLVQKKNTKLTLRVYVYDNYIDEALVMKHTKPNGNVKQYWYLHNQQFSVYALLNDSGKILETYHYSAYGEPQIETASGGIISTTAYDNHYLYTGRLLDQETELFYFRNRYYHSSQGRFISRDPIGYVDGMSLYRGYFAVNGVDWSGLDDVSSGMWNRITNFASAVGNFVSSTAQSAYRDVIEKPLGGVLAAAGWALGAGGFSDINSVGIPFIRERMDDSPQAAELERLMLRRNKNKKCSKWTDSKRVGIDFTFSIALQGLIEGNSLSFFHGSMAGKAWVLAYDCENNCSGSVVVHYRLSDAHTVDSLTGGIFTKVHFGWQSEKYLLKEEQINPTKGFFANWHRHYDWKKTYKCDCD